MATLGIYKQGRQFWVGFSASREDAAVEVIWKSPNGERLASYVLLIVYNSVLWLEIPLAVLQLNLLIVMAHRA